MDNNSTNDSICKIESYCNGQLRFNSKLVDYSENNKPIKFVKFDRSNEDNKIKYIKKLDLNKNLIILKNDKNDGFAEGNNVGVRCAMDIFSPEYVLILNNDTVVEKNMLAEMIDVCKKMHNVGVVGGKSYHYDSLNRLGCSGGRINFWTGKITCCYSSQIDIGQFRDIEERDYIAGVCMLISLKCLDNGDLFNPIFFFGGCEDIDVCLRVKNKGYKCFSTPKAILWHKGESKQSLTINKERLRLYAYYSIRNYLILIKLHWSGLKRISILIFLPWRFMRPLFVFFKNRWDIRLLKEPLLGVIDLIVHSR